MASPRGPRALAKVGRVRSILEISTRLHHKKIHFSCEAHCHENDRLDQPLMHQLVMHYLEADPIPYASLNGIECGFTVQKHRLPGSTHQWSVTGRKADCHRVRLAGFTVVINRRKKHELRVRRRKAGRRGRGRRFSDTARGQCQPASWWLCCKPKQIRSLSRRRFFVRRASGSIPSNKASSKTDFRFHAPTSLFQAHCWHRLLVATLNGQHFSLGGV